MKVIDLNADIGEADNPGWAQAERDILRYVSSANIACGGHAGDERSMRAIVRAAKLRGVNIGAHPSYPDRENFGRKSLAIGHDIDRAVLRDSLLSQIMRLSEIASEEGACITYVKPHGALYNDAVHDREKAELIAGVISALDTDLIFMGGPRSEMGKAAKKFGLEFIAEGFIDRRYTDDGHLQSRKIEGAVIKDQDKRMAQLRGLVTKGTVKTASGTELHIAARSLCLHGDSAGAVKTARLARKVIEDSGVSIEAFAHAA